MLNELIPETDSCIIYLIRHGATDANMAKPYILQGCTIDLPLNETGKAQLYETSKRLSVIKFDAVYASYLKRARESAGIISSPHNLTPLVHQGIHEIDVGEWEGLSWDIISQRDPEYYQHYIKETALTPYKGGESYSDVAERVMPAIHQLGRLNQSRRIVLVAHNIVNRVVIAHTMGLQLNTAKDLKQNNGCINILKWKDNALSLITYNEISHLNGLS